MNPKVEKKNVLPYGSKGLRIGIDWALLFVGLMDGAFHSKFNLIVALFRVGFRVIFGQLKGEVGDVICSRIFPKVGGLTNIYEVYTQY